MREGYWLNARTGKHMEVDEHCMFIKDIHRIKQIGAPERLYNEIENLNCVTDREKILRATMEYDMIRIRGHGNFVTAEFTMETEKALWALKEFYEWLGLGPFSVVNIFNIRTNENVEMSYAEFTEKIANDDMRGILRIAKERQLAIKIAKEMTA